MKKKSLSYLLTSIYFLIIYPSCFSQDCRNYTLVLKPHLLFLTYASLYEEGKEEPIYTMEYKFFE